MNLKGNFSVKRLTMPIYVRTGVQLQHTLPGRVDGWSQGLRIGRTMSHYQ
jgi:hypothetical protein